MFSTKPLRNRLFPKASGPDDVDQLLGISIEHLTKQVPFPHIPRGHDFYHLFWIKSGDGTLLSGGRSYPLTPGGLIFVPPGQVHACKWSYLVKGYVLSFEPALLFRGNDWPYPLLHDLAQFSAKIKDRATFQSAGLTYQTLRLAFKRLANEFHGNAEFRCDMVRSQITELLIRLHRLCLSTRSTSTLFRSGAQTENACPAIATKYRPYTSPHWYGIADRSPDRPCP